VPLVLLFMKTLAKGEGFHEDNTIQVYKNNI
jgi:hypothetical protein